MSTPWAVAHEGASSPWAVAVNVLKGRLMDNSFSAITPTPKYMPTIARLFKAEQSSSIMSTVDRGLGSSK